MSGSAPFTDSLKQSNLCFKNILDLVPANAFFDADSNQKISAHQSSEATKAVKHKSNQGDKVKAKKVKYDPSQPLKTSELQQLLPTLNGLGETDDEKDATLEEESEADDAEQDSEPEDKEEIKTNNGKVKKAKKLNKINNIHPSVNGGKHKIDTPVDSDLADTSGLNGDIDTEQADTPAKKSKKSVDATSSENSSGPSPLTIQPQLDTDQLREKLRARISELQAKRQHGMTAEEFMESKKLRRKESKLKLKQKRKEAKKLKLSVEKQAKNSQNKLNGVSEVKSDPDKNANNNNKMVFSKFQFSEQAQKPKDRKQKKPKSYKDLYEKVTKDKAKLQQLKETDADKAKQLEEKTAWRKAMDQSRGIKVKDNPELIKKSMKKEEKMKQRNQKKWEERRENVADQMQRKQDKRKKNIAAKKQTKVDRKIKLAKKKGRVVSGF